MAMSKDEQREASRRILKKEPLTGEELERYEMLSKTPEQYVRPDDEGRTCGVCGARFKDSQGQVVQSALEKFADHQAEHNPTPAQWAEAHDRIRLARAT